MNKRAEKFQKFVQLERQRQNKAFPNEEKQRNIPLHQWNTILTEEVGEFAKDVNDHAVQHSIYELVEIAAVCQKIFELNYSDEAVELAEDFLSNRMKIQQQK